VNTISEHSAIFLKAFTFSARPDRSRAISAGQRACKGEVHVGATACAEASEIDCTAVATAKTPTISVAPVIRPRLRDSASRPEISPFSAASVLARNTRNTVTLR
jgi:hypothetical protein